MKIHKFILTLATLLATGSAAAAGLAAGTVPAFYPGNTATVAVTADLPEGTSALQFTVTVPAAFSLRSLDVNKDAAPDHLSRVYQATDSTYNYVLYSNSNTSFAAGDDYLFGLKLRTETNAASGDYTLKIGNIIASDASGKETRLEVLSVPVPVYIKVTKVIVEPLKATIAPGESLQLAATVQPDNAVQDVTWESTGPEVVSVDENGLVKGLATGSVRITARSKIFPDYYGYCDIVVAAVKATSIVLDRESIDLRMGTTATLKATVSPDNTTDPSVAWTSSDNSVVTVDENGNLTPVKAGKATVTASTTDGSSLKASCAVNVLPPLATSVSVSHDMLTLTVMETAVLTATVAPADALQAVEWKSSNDEIATVAPDGTVTALAEGSATISAIATDGSGVTGACSVTVNPAKVTSITLGKTALGLRIGQSETLTATVLPEYAADRSLAWWTDNTKVATVDANGKVTAVALGEATITANAIDGSGVSAACKVTVTNALAEGIAIDVVEATLRVRESLKLTATVSPEGAVGAVNWSSSAPEVAAVDADGNVSAISPGNATVTATTADGTGLTAKCEITVEPVLVESVALDKNTLDLHVGESAVLTATVLPDYAGNRTLAWTSDNETVAAVDANGTVTAVAPGTAVVTAAATDGSGMKATCKVSVTNALASGIAIDVVEATLRVRESLKLTATVSPESAVGAVNWSSSAPEVAAVDADGNVSAISPGNATVTATTADGTGLTASCKITVEPALVESVALDKNTLDLHVGESAVLTATVLPDYAGNRTVTWRSSAPDVAIVDSNGRVIGMAEGLAVVTATAADGSGAYDQCIVTVERIRATAITIEPQELTIEQGDTVQVKAIVYPADIVAGVEWSSLSPGIATVDAGGNIAGVEIGTAVITATTTDGSDLTATCLVTVTESTGIAYIECGRGAVTVENGSEIVVRGVDDAAVVRVVNTAGICVYSGTARRIAGLAPGFYMVIVENTATKVILR